MRMISADDVDRALTFDRPGGNACGRHSETGAMQPVRHHHTIERPEGAASTLLLMPAWTDFNAAGTSDGGHIGVKMVTVSPDNNAIGKPAVMGLYLLLDGRTGEPQALIDGQRLTQWRTAAASALAASYLARRCVEAARHRGRRALPLPRQGAFRGAADRRNPHMEPHARQCAKRPPRRCVRTASMRPLSPISMRRSAGPTSYPRATISTEPLVRGARCGRARMSTWSAASRPTCAKPTMRRSRAPVFIVDTRAGATKEAGDIVQPLKSGVLKRRRHRRRLCTNLPAAKGGPRSGATRSRCSNRSGRRSKILPAGIAVYERLKA